MVANAAKGRLMSMDIPMQRKAEKKLLKIPHKSLHNKFAMA